jgi:hypothetical protein
MAHIASGKIPGALYPGPIGVYKHTLTAVPSISARVKKTLTKEEKEKLQKEYDDELKNLNEELESEFEAEEEKTQKLLEKELQKLLDDDEKLTPQQHQQQQALQQRRKALQQQQVDEQIKREELLKQQQLVDEQRKREELLKQQQQALQQQQQQQQQLVDEQRKREELLKHQQQALQQQQKQQQQQQQEQLAKKQQQALPQQEEQKRKQQQILQQEEQKRKHQEEQLAIQNEAEEEEIEKDINIFNEKIVGQLKSNEYLARQDQEQEQELLKRRLEEERELTKEGHTFTQPLIKKEKLTNEGHIVFLQSLIKNEKERQERGTSNIYNPPTLEIKTLNIVDDIIKCYKTDDINCLQFTNLNDYKESVIQYQPIVDEKKTKELVYNLLKKIVNDDDGIINSCLKNINKDFIPGTVEYSIGQFMIGYITKYKDEIEELKNLKSARGKGELSNFITASAFGGATEVISFKLINKILIIILIILLVIIIFKIVITIPICKYINPVEQLIEYPTYLPPTLTITGPQ